VEVNGNFHDPVKLRPAPCGFKVNNGIHGAKIRWLLAFTSALIYNPEILRLDLPKHQGMWLGDWWVALI
jgi:hypothetical protein